MLLLAAVIAVFGLCFSVFNYWFQKEKYNRLTKAELEAGGRKESPRIWLVLGIVFFISLLCIISYYIFQLALAIRQMQG